jgi:dTDP-4-dehydrorhamnose 3,5-epimerase
MVVDSTPIAGAFVITPKTLRDHRGFFARLWCMDEFARLGLTTHFTQSNVGFSERKGTLRGLHYQATPHQEVKLVRCTKGAVFDVLVDLRRDSPTHTQWFGLELSEENRKLLYVPEGCAQGYITLRDSAEIYYDTSAAYAGHAAFGVRYDDPQFGIVWPIPPEVISEQDRNWPEYEG